MIGFSEPIYKTVVFILAGNYSQYIYYMHKLRELVCRAGMDDRVELKYLNEGRKLHGHRSGYFIRVGTWYQIRDRELDEILTLLNVLEFEEIEYSENERMEKPMDIYMPWEENRFEFLSEQEMTIES